MKKILAIVVGLTLIQTLKAESPNIPRGSGCPCHADGQQCYCKPASICPNCPQHASAVAVADPLDAKIAALKMELCQLKGVPVTTTGHWETRVQCNGVSCTKTQVWVPGTAAVAVITPPVAVYAVRPVLFPRLFWRFRR